MLGLARAVSGRGARRLDRSMPFFNMDYIFTRFPNLARDKVHYMKQLLLYSFVAGFVGVFALINPPYQGADYENIHKSLLYKWRISRLDQSGQLQENTRIKRDYFYSPGGPADPNVKVPDEE